MYCITAVRIKTSKAKQRRITTRHVREINKGEITCTQICVSARLSQRQHDSSTASNIRRLWHVLH